MSEPFGVSLSHSAPPFWPTVLVPLALIVFLACWPRVVLLSLLAAWVGLAIWLFSLVFRFLAALGPAVQVGPWLFIGLLLAALGLALGAGALLFTASKSILFAGQSLFAFLSFLAEKVPVLVRPWWVGILAAPWVFMSSGGMIGPISWPGLSGGVVAGLVACVLLCWFLYPRDLVFPDFWRTSQIEKELFLEWLPFYSGNWKDIAFEWMFAGLFSIVGLVCMMEVQAPRWMELVGHASEGRHVGREAWLAAALAFAAVSAAGAFPKQFLRLVLRLCVILALFYLGHWGVKTLTKALFAPQWASLPASVVVVLAVFLAIREIALWQNKFDCWLWEYGSHVWLRLAGVGAFLVAFAALASDTPPSSWAIAWAAGFAGCLGLGMQVMRHTAPEPVIGLRPLLAPAVDGIAGPVKSAERFLRQIADERRQARRRLELQRLEALEKKRKAELFEEHLKSGRVREFCSEPRMLKCRHCGNDDPEHLWDNYSCPVCGGEHDPLPAASCSTCKRQTTAEPGCRACHSVAIYQQEESLLPFKHN